MVFPLIRSMTELLLPTKQEEKRKAQQRFANRDAMQRYIKLTEQMNKRIKRKKTKRVYEQSLKKSA